MKKSSEIKLTPLHLELLREFAARMIRKYITFVAKEEG